MRTKIATIIATLTTISLSLPSQAENLTHLNQLLSTKKCSQCDLSGSGLVTIDLTGADLRGANLVNANLSQANLTGADLSNANLTGTSLYGANLTGANLTNARLSNTDLRNAYLVNTHLEGVNLDAAYLDGVRGISTGVATPEQFHRWGVRESDRGNYRGAIAHYHRAININPEFAPAFMGLSIAYYRSHNRGEAIRHSQIASQLFAQQKNELGQKTAEEFIKNIELASQIEGDMEKRERGIGNFSKFLGGIGSLLLQLAL